MFFFFFSSRRRHTRFDCDWSSDVCSSDLDDSLTVRERAVAAWPSAWQGQNLRDILTTLGHDIDVPWRNLPRKTREWILFTDEQPTVPVYPGLTVDEARRARLQQPPRPEDPGLTGDEARAARPTGPPPRDHGDLTR